MQLELKTSKSLFIRLLLCAASIILLLGIVLAWLINQLHAEQNYNLQTEALMAEIPDAIKQLKQQIAPDTSPAIDKSLSPVSFIMVSCDNSFNQVWASKLATHRNLDNTCNRYKKIKDDSPPHYLQLSDGLSYLVYPLPIESSGKQYKLLILKNAYDFSKEYQQFSKKTFMLLFLILIATFVLLIAGALWGLKPFRKMRKELKKIHAGTQQQLNQAYPSEFSAIAHSINQLIEHSNYREEKYKNTLGDLAHSLKTRLASIQALTEGATEQNQSKISDQLQQMNGIVSYHLKRATLGKKHIQRESSKVSEPISQVSNVMQKVYQGKEIELTADIPADISISMAEDDLLELCGNLLENAFRLCSRQVHIEVYNGHGNCQLLIEDDGPGINDNLKQRILERGIRADTSHSGSGIGLAICLEIVTSYSGQFHVEDSALGGAKMRISIPD
ncbi:MAG: ATP-binding protein [Parashewanella sp.]